MFSEYFYVTVNEGLFSGMSMKFMEVLSGALLLVVVALIFPLTVFSEEKKIKPLIKCLAVFIPTLISLFTVIWYTPIKGPVRVVSSKDRDKYILVEDIDVAEEVVRMANDVNVRNKEEINSLVKDLINLKEK